jgi:hypothetical protein
MNDAEEVHRIVRERYGEIARAGTIAPAELLRAALRGAGTARGVRGDRRRGGAGARTSGSAAAPLAHAALRAGEVVLDLGSGAGFDAFLAARESRRRRPRDRRRHDARDRSSAPA